MTQFQQNTGIGDARLGIGGSLSAPGVVPVPVAVPGRSKLEQVVLALNLASRNASRIGGEFRRERLDREREQAKVDRLYAGQAAEDAATYLPTVLNEIEQRQRMVPEGVEIEQHVRDTLGQILPEDMAKPYRDEYQRIMLPRLTAAFTAQQQAIVDEARDEDLRLISESVIADPAQATRAIEQAREIDPNLTETELLNRVVVPSLRNATATGNAAQFDEASKALGHRFPGVRAQLRQQLEARNRVNAAQEERDRLEAINEVVALELQNTAPNFDAAREFVRSAGDISEAARTGLLDNLDTRERQAEARHAAEIEGQIDQLASTNPTPEAFGQAVRSIQQANPDAISAFDAQQITDAFTTDAIKLAASRGEATEVQSLGALLSGGDDDARFVADQVQVAIRVGRDNTTDRIISGVQAGTVRTTDALTLAQAGALRFNQDSGDPSGLTPNHVRQIVSAAGGKEVSDTADIAVISKIQGGPGALSERQHAKSLDKAIGPEGLGLINELNQITDPKALGQVVLNAGITTPNLRDTLIANMLQGGQPQQHATDVMGQVANGSAMMFAKIKDSASDNVKPGLSEVQAAARRGNGVLALPETQRAIRDALSIERPDEEARKESVDAIKRALGDKKLDDYIDDTLEKAAQQLPHATDTLGEAFSDALPESFGDAAQTIFGPTNVASMVGLGSTSSSRFAAGFFDIVDPSVDKADEDAARFFRNQLSKNFSTFTVNGKLPTELALELAQRDAIASFHNEFTVVRWRGRVYPVRAGNDRGELPPSLRWSELTEDEAVSDFNQAVKDGLVTGIDTDDINSMVPVFEGNDPNQWGWLYIVDGVHVINQKTGRPLLYRPTDEAQAAADRQQKLLDEKIARGVEPSVTDQALNAPRTPSVPTRSFLTPEEEAILGSVSGP